MVITSAEDLLQRSRLIKTAKKQKQLDLRKQRKQQLVQQQRIQRDIRIQQQQLQAEKLQAEKNKINEIKGLPVKTRYLLGDPNIKGIISLDRRNVYLVDSGKRFQGKTVYNTSEGTFIGMPQVVEKDTFDGSEKILIGNLVRGNTIYNYKPFIKSNGRRSFKLESTGESFNPTTTKLSYNIEKWTARGSVPNLRFKQRLTSLQQKQLNAGVKLDLSKEKITRDSSKIAREKLILSGKVKPTKSELKFGIGKSLLELKSINNEYKLPRKITEIKSISKRLQEARKYKNSKITNIKKFETVKRVRNIKELQRDNLVDEVQKSLGYSIPLKLQKKGTKKEIIDFFNKEVKKTQRRIKLNEKAFGTRVKRELQKNSKKISRGVTFSRQRDSNVTSIDLSVQKSKEPNSYFQRSKRDIQGNLLLSRNDAVKLIKTLKSPKISTSKVLENSEKYLSTLSSISGLTGALKIISRFSGKGKQKGSTILDIIIPKKYVNLWDKVVRKNFVSDYNNILSDPDVKQTLLMGTFLLGSNVISGLAKIKGLGTTATIVRTTAKTAQFGLKGAGITITGITSIKSIKNPTPENLAITTFFALSTLAAIFGGKSKYPKNVKQTSKLKVKLKNKITNLQKRRLKFKTITNKNKVTKEIIDLNKALKDLNLIEKSYKTSKPIIIKKKISVGKQVKKSLKIRKKQTIKQGKKSKLSEERALRLKKVRIKVKQRKQRALIQKIRLQKLKAKKSLKKGKTPKATRDFIVKNGKRIYVVEEPLSGKQIEFKSRKEWLKFLKLLATSKGKEKSSIEKSLTKLNKLYKIERGKLNKELNELKLQILRNEKILKSGKSPKSNKVITSKQRKIIVQALKNYKIKQLKLKKISAGKQRVILNKIKLQKLRLIKLEKKGKTPKAVRSIKKITWGKYKDKFVLEDRFGRVNTFTTRKAYLRALKQQIKSGEYTKIRVKAKRDIKKRQNAKTRDLRIKQNKNIRQLERDLALQRKGKLSKARRTLSKQRIKELKKEFKEGKLTTVQSNKVNKLFKTKTLKELTAQRQLRELRAKAHKLRIEKKGGIPKARRTLSKKQIKQLKKTEKFRQLSQKKSLKELKLEEFIINTKLNQIFTIINKVNTKQIKLKSFKLKALSKIRKKSLPGVEIKTGKGQRAVLLLEKPKIKVKLKIKKGSKIRTIRIKKISELKRFSSVENLFKGKILYNNGEVQTIYLFYPQRKLASESFQEFKSRLIFKPVQLIRSVSMPKIKLQQKIKTNIKSKQKIVQKQKIAQKQKLGQKQRISQKQNIKQIVDIIQKIALIPAQKIKNILKINTITIPTLITIPKINKLLIDLPELKYNKLGLGYNVLIKTPNLKKKFTRINAKPLTKIDSLKFGRYVSDNTPRASFSIERSGTKVGMKFKKSSKKIKFRKPVKNSKLKTKRETFVEKKKYRIDTFGEKKGISVKGIRKFNTEKSILRRFKNKIKKKSKKIKNKK